MQKLSVREFKEYCDKLVPHRFIFDTENQEWCNIGETLKIKLVFGSIIINFNPNTICLSSPLGKIIFERVKYIEMGDTSMIGAVFTIVCAGYNDKSYTIVVD